MTMSKSMLVTERKTKPILVVKLGGSMLERLSDEFYKSFQELNRYYHCMIVHGGGPAITSLMDRLGIEGEFHEGLRKTTDEALEAVEMALAGKVNARITSHLSSWNVKAIGIKGSDASLLMASYVNREALGHVGEVESVNSELLHTLIREGYTPVVAPLGKTKEGQTVNINADTAAAAIAKAVGAERLLFVTDVPGIMRQGELIEETTPDEIESLIDRGWIYGGMIPKVKSAVEALSDQLNEVMIVSGERSLISDNQMRGTVIREKRRERVE